MNKKGQAELFGVVFVMLIILIGGILLVGVDFVNVDKIGVKNRFGKILGTMSGELAWTGLFTGVTTYSLRERQRTIDMTEGDQTSVDMDGQGIRAMIQVNYKFNPEHAVDAYTRVGRDSSLFRILNIEGILREGFKQTTSQYTSKYIWQNRQEVKEEAIKNIQANFPKYFTLTRVVISDLGFNQAFLDAIESQKTNIELAIAAEKAVNIAKFKADAKIQEARGKSEASMLKTDAEAYDLEMKRQQLTEMMIKQSWIEAWDGQLPIYVMGTSESTELLLNVPTGN